MDIRSCRNCGKLFQFRGAYTCPDCARDADEKFTKVRNYMYENPSASIEQICEDNDVSAEMVMGWLREGRLIVDQKNNPLLKCSSCGKPISSGRLCAACSSNFMSQIDSTSKDLARDIQRRKEEADKRGYHTELR